MHSSLKPLCLLMLVVSGPALHAENTSGNDDTAPRPFRKLSEEEKEDEAPGMRVHPDDMTSEGRASLCRAFCKRLERGVSAEFVDMPLGEVLVFVQTLCKSSIKISPSAATRTLRTRTTYHCTDMPAGLVLDDVLAKVGLDWTIYVTVHVDTPERIKELDRKYPEMAQVVLYFRKRMRARLEVREAERSDVPDAEKKAIDEVPKRPMKDTPTAE